MYSYTVTPRESALEAESSSCSARPNIYVHVHTYIPYALQQTTSPGSSAKPLHTKKDSPQKLRTSTGTRTEPQNRTPPPPTGQGRKNSELSSLDARATQTPPFSWEEIVMDGQKTNNARINYHLTKSGHVNNPTRIRGYIPGSYTQYVCTIQFTYWKEGKWRTPNNYSTGAAPM